MRKSSVKIFVYMKDGLQSPIWSGYFDEEKDSIMGSWKRCDVCKKIPCEIYYDSSDLFRIYTCHNCKKSEYKPKNILQKILLKFNA